MILNSYKINNKESLEHKNEKNKLKSLLENKKISNITRKCVNCHNEIFFLRLLDINYNRIELEKELVYNNSKIYADVYCKLKDNDKYINFEIVHTLKTEPCARPEPWFEVNALDIQKFDENQNLNIKKNLICKRIQKCEKCVAENKGIIYFNQRGAGCGKTFESIQIMQNDDRFRYKEIYIYLTKMHSAKDVIYSELKDQEKKKLLCNLLIKEDNEKGKQYYISYDNIKYNKQVIVIIGTIDSFAYSLVKKDNNNIFHLDFFKRIINFMKEGYFKFKNNNEIQYAGKVLELNKKTLIILDEAQDLGQDYLYAFDSLINETKIDLYIIGDKLQSISGEENLLTHIKNKNFTNKIIESDGVNKVMRFHNKNFIHFVNKVIPFNKYDLPHITGICDLDGCIHKDDEIPYQIFYLDKNIKELYLDIEYAYRESKKIIEYMEFEININKYLPKDFMFIFPILSDNAFAMYLRIEIQNFWINKFNDEEYQKNVLLKDEFWKNKINSISKNDYFNYIYLHKSNEGQSINLKESENSSRILSIHSSKGNGCNVVFLLGIDDSSLLCFTHKKNNLVFDSLLHVAITRQKRKLYIGIINEENSEIVQRFKPFNIEDSQNNHVNINFSKSVTMKKIISSISDNDYVKLIKNNCIKQRDLDLIKEKLNNSDEHKNTIIDYGHHMLRYAIYYLHFIFRFSNFQLKSAIEKLLKRKIVICSNDTPDAKIVYDSLYKNNNDNKNYLNIYYKLLDTMKYYKNNNDNEGDKNRKYQNNECFPILEFNKGNNDSSKYKKYSNYLKKNCEFVINKLKKINLYNNFNIDDFCPIELIILYLLISQQDKGINSDISILDIYDIFDYYEKVDINTINEYKCKYKCGCYDYFENLHNNNNIISRYCEHYESLNNIKINLNLHEKKYENKKTEYSISKTLYFNKKEYDDDEFNISSIFKPIGYNDKEVIVVIIRPDLNNINFNQIILECLMNNLIILNNKSDKYKNKSVTNVIFTLNLTEPIYINFDFDINNKKLSQNFIIDFVTNKYLEFHNIIYEYCKLKFTEVNEDKNRYKDLEIFKEINKKLKYLNTDSEKLFKNFKNGDEYKDKFIKKLKQELEKKIKLFFDLEEDSDDDD